MQEDLKDNYYDNGFYEIMELDSFYEEEEEDEEDVASFYSLEDGLTKSWIKYKCVNFSYISSITGLSTSEIIKMAGGHYIWQDPVVYAMNEEEEEGWFYPRDYFKGNLYKLLDIAIEMHSVYGRFEANIQALKKEIKKRFSGKQKFEQVRFVPGHTILTGEIHSRYIKEKLNLNILPHIERCDHLQTWLVEKIDNLRPIGKNYVKKGNKYVAARNYTYETDRMDMLTIMEHIMNGITIKIHDTEKRADKKDGVRILNKEETLAAQERADFIKEDFNNWIHNTEDVRQEVEELYYKRYSYANSEYDGSMLKFPGLNPKIQLYLHQKRASARILTNQNTLLNYDTGAGKTLAMVIAAYETKRLELSQKTLIVVPLNVFDEMVKTFAYAYPKANILAVHNRRDFNTKTKEETLSKIKNNDYDAIIMASSSFDQVGMSYEYKCKKMEREIRRYKNAQRVAQQSRMVDHELAKKLKKLEKKYEEFKKVPKISETDCFEQLGITMLIVDECHHYKNITLDSNLDIVGNRNKGSEKADSLLEKVHYVQQQDGKVVFATGTPLVNSLSDLYVLQKYLQSNELEFCNISKFGQWANAFAQSETYFDFNIAQEPRFVTRFVSFHNLHELRNMFGMVCDTYHSDKEELNLPEFQGHENVIVKKIPEQEEYDKEILERIEKIHLKLVGKNEDNFLLITMDARNASTDIRIVKEDIKREITYSKSSVCAEKMLEFYNRYPGKTQIAFCDCSTPKAKFNVYDELRKQLELRGILADEIAYIHDGTTESKRTKLLGDFNDGRIRIMIGSTQKLGTGVNVQENLIAVHHIDVPWRPADFMQREGRIIRQGNKNERVYVFRYITENSFDAYLWQLIESKQKFINSFLAGELDPDEYETSDIANIILSYAEAKALAVGNPLIKKRVETANQIERLRMLQRQRRRELEELQIILKNTPQKIEKLNQLIRFVDEDRRYYQRHKEVVSKEEREGFGEVLLEELEMNFMQSKERVFDEYQGFDVILPKHMSLERPYVIVQREGGGSYRVDMKGDKAVGCSQRIDYLFNRFSKLQEEHIAKREQLKKDIKQAKENLAKGNPYDDELLHTIEALHQIDAELNAS